MCVGLGITKAIHLNNIRKRHIRKVHQQNTQQLTKSFCLASSISWLILARRHADVRIAASPELSRLAEWARDTRKVRANCAESQAAAADIGHEHAKRENF